MLTHAMPCVPHMACHVSHMHAFSMHYDTWLAMCHYMACHGSPCVIHMARHVSLDTCFLKIREIPTISDSTKFDWVAKFYEMIPTVQFVLSSEI